MEELRDSEIIQKILDFMEKIKGSFESIKGSGLNLFEWKIGYFAKKWVQIQNFLKNLKIPTGDLTESLTKIEECLQTFDFSMDFSTEESGAVKLEESFKEVRDKMNLYARERHAVEESKILAAVMNDMAKWLETEEKDWDRFAKIMAGFNSGGNIDLIVPVS
ncbi:hypothetical protein CAEBREN_06275 [Caenorhabditis brenneri]|uniref:Uncharacterized protein n=1 Tax=Caenorhabditis brenneri TaxID=135651 RepID=G0NC20_CAEBE|nr:hypothetical protein CAEBREN_06275 [Caenorhabditis brenneri]